MQPLSARLRSLRRERFDSATGRRRRGGVAVAAGLALALFVGSGIAVAAVSSVEAHTPAINSDCTGVSVDAWDYNEASTSTVTVTIVGGNSDGTDLVETRTFTTEFHEKFLFPDSSIGWSYSASIDAPDGTDGTQWDYGWSDTTKGCATPDIGITASTCIHPGDRTTVDAVISPLEPSHAYKVRLTGTNGYDSGEQDVQTTSYSWSDLDPGFSYTATLTDITSKLTDQDTVVVVGCPQDPSFDVVVTQCAAPGGNGSFAVTVSGLVPGRNYVLSLVSEAGGAPEDVPFTATASTFSNPFVTLPSGRYHATLTDVADGTSKSSDTAVYLPCPAAPFLLVQATVCSATDGVSDASLEARAVVVPGRSYSIVVTTAASTVYTESLAPATSSDWRKTLPNVDPGQYTVTVTDTTDPASAVFSKSIETKVAPCPTQPEIAITPQQCSIPGGQGSLTAKLTNLAVGGAYRATLWQGGAPDPRIDNTFLIPVYQGTTFDVAWNKLTPGGAYRIVVTDDLHPGVTAAADILLTDCPGNPDLVITQPTCTLFTTTTITTGLAKLIPGETYTVSVTKTSDGTPVAGVPDQQVAATAPTASLTFADLPVGREYTVTVTNATKTLTATGKLFLTLCDLPTLAYTGASTMTPTLAGLGFLQFGLVLVGISLVRRRSGAREV